MIAADFARFTLTSLRSHRLRTGLTALGISTMEAPPWAD